MPFLAFDQKGSFALRTHEGADTVNFHDPRSQTGIIRPPVTELTAENTDQVVVKVSDGTLRRPAQVCLTVLSLCLRWALSH